jgi:hypothetical protein
MALGEGYFAKGGMPLEAGAFIEKTAIEFETLRERFGIVRIDFDDSHVQDRD